MLPVPESCIDKQGRLEPCGNRGGLLLEFVPDQEYVYPEHEHDENEKDQRS